VGQRVRLGVLISIPFLMVLVLVGMAAAGKFNSARVMPPEQKQLSNAEVAQRMLPDLNKDLNLETNKEVQIANVVVGAGKITGILKNNTDRIITDVEVVFDLASNTGSRVGAASVKVARIEPHGSAPFANPVPQQDAAYAIVREVHNQ